MSDESSSGFDNLVGKARDYSIPRGRRLAALLQSGTKPPRVSWHVDLDRLTLLVNEAPRVRARFQLIGLQWWKEARWRWAWAESNVDALLLKDAEKTRRFGSEHGIQELITPELTVVGQLPTDLAAIASLTCAGDATWVLPMRPGVFDLIVLHDVKSADDVAA